MLPDEVLLAIFDFCVDQGRGVIKKGKAWQTLVHVCRLWRNLVLLSPRRLNLRLFCTPKTPVRTTLDVWPALPICVHGDGYRLTESADDILAALGDRIRQVAVQRLTFWEFKELCATMQVPFPELTDLYLSAFNDWMPVVPDSFLGGSAPRLRDLHLERIPFPGLPKLLLSATHLVTLRLRNIPQSGYVSPEAMVTCLSSLTNLHQLVIQFQFPQSRPDPESQHLSPPTRSVLPNLILFKFKGVGEYLEDLVAHIDAPRLNCLEITIFKQNHSEIPQLVQLIGRTPSLGALKKASITFTSHEVNVTLLSQISGHGRVSVEILNKSSVRNTEWQALALARVCRSALPLLSEVENLCFHEPGCSLAGWHGDIKARPWLKLLRLFTAVKNLYLSEKCEPCIASALQKLVRGRTMEVLPTLQNLFLWGFRRSGPVHKGIGQFVAARQLTSNPISVSRRDRTRSSYKIF
jgi:hypothetical protein